MMIDTSRIRTLQQQILGRYEVYGRDLPWRKTDNPYYILLSEVMSQQTQVSRVVEYYHRFVQYYPLIQDLAVSSKTELLSLWSGLGYNSRALRLQQACNEIVQRHDGVVPDDYASLIALSGVGPYTANAVLAFAYNQEVPVMDTNIRRILLYSFDLPHDTSMSDLMSIALSCIPSGQSRIWHNALMDYGALVLTSAVTGIKPLTKQSAFEGSARQTRSLFLKYLLTHQEASYDALMNIASHLHKSDILQKMINEGILICQGDMYRIKE